MASSDVAVEQGYPPTEHLQGIVERVTYHAEDSGYTVARLKVPSAHDLITTVGSFPDIHAGQTLRLWPAVPSHVGPGNEAGHAHRPGKIPGQWADQRDRSRNRETYCEAFRPGYPGDHRAILLPAHRSARNWAAAREHD